MEADIRKKEKVKKVIEFVEKMKKIQEEAGIVFKKVQEEIKRQVDKKRKQVKEWIRGNKVMLNINNLVFKKGPIKKLIKQYIGPYIIE